MIIREVATIDYYEVLDVLRDSFGPIEIDLSTFNRVIWSDNRKMFVGIEDNKIVTTYSVVIEDKLIHNGGKVAHLEDLATKKEYRNKGYATQMMKYMLDFCKKQGCYKAIHSCPDHLVEYYKKIAGMRIHETSMRVDL